MKTMTRKIAEKIHDAKIINIQFHYDFMVSNDICFKIEQDTIGLNIQETSIFYNLTFIQVYNFKIHFDSGEHDFNLYPANISSDCLYIYDLQIIDSKNQQIHWRIDLINKQFIDIYAEEIQFLPCHKN